MDIAELQTAVDAWIKTHGVRYFNELTNMTILVQELSDVLWVLVCLANQTGVDLNEAVNNNFAKKTARDANRHKKNPKLLKD